MTAGAAGRPPPDIDLSGLERAVVRLGWPELRARLVEPGRRRDPWFRRSGDELLVSERIVERLAPADAEILLVNTLLRERGVGRLQMSLVAAGLTAGLAGLLAFALVPGQIVAVGGLLIVGFGVAAAVGWSRATLAADDETVRLTGDPDTLVRALNVMNQDELHVGPWRFKARGGIHDRAERLVAQHQLRLPPERRTVPIVRPVASWIGAGRGLPRTGCAHDAPRVPDAPASPMAAEGAAPHPVPDARPPARG